MFVIFNCLQTKLFQNVVWRSDLINVDGCDPPRVTLQGKKAAGVLQPINLNRESNKNNNGKICPDLAHFSIVFYDDKESQ